MEQATATMFGVEPNPLDSTGLCLLSLDGGGVRGLSTLYSLKVIMDRLNGERKKSDLIPVKPCEVFDLIGGTSTGGLIAIMLGRLEMDVDECITAYSELAKVVFRQNLSSVPSNTEGKVKERFDSVKLEKAIREVVQRASSETDLFNDGTERGCRTFVCTVDRDTKDIIRLRSYNLPDEPNIRATICQAALATLAASVSFDPVDIGDRTFDTFDDGGLGSNNPVDEVEGEAANIWCSETGDLKPLVKCFISIGTGNPGKKAFEDSLVKFLGQAVSQIAAETEITEKNFIARWAKHFDEKRYYRFNVKQGLQHIGLDEYRKQGMIRAATERYLAHLRQNYRVQDCILNLRLKQAQTKTSFAAVLNEYTARAIRLQLADYTLWNVPFERNHRFTGRESQLAQLQEKIFAEDRTTKIAIAGLGGVGKTQLVLELAYRIRDKHKKCSVLWIPAMNIETLQQAYLDVAQQLGIPGWDVNNADIKRLIQEYLSKESSGQWLLVFDNTNNINMWTDKREEGCLIEYLPRSKQGCIIFTIRDREMAIKLAHQNVVEVPGMNDKAATQLLQKYLVNPDLFTNDDDTKALLTQLTNLPLAIVQAAAYINANGITFAEYLSVLAAQEEDIIEILSEEFEDDGRYHDVKNPVATTWLISFEQLRQRNPLAVAYLSFMSCMAPKDIPQSLLPRGPSRKQEIDAIATLHAYSLIMRPSDIVVHIHQLVHFLTRNWLRTQQLLGHWTEKAIERLKNVIPDHDHQNRTIWRAYLPHATYVLVSDLANRDGLHRIDLLWRYGMCLYQDGQWSEAETSFRQVMENRKRILGQEHPDTILAMSNLSITLGDLGRLDEAATMKEEVLEKMRRILGEDHPSTITAMNNLAFTLGELGQLDKAARMKKEVLRKRRRILGDEHPATITAASNLSATLGDMGQLNEAATMKKEVLEKRIRILGEEHPDTILAMNNFAVTLRDLGQLDEAATMTKEVLERRIHILGEEHPDTILAMNNLAVTLEDLGHLDEAITLLEVAVQRMKRAHGTEHPRTKVAASNLTRLVANKSTSESIAGKVETDLEAKSDDSETSKPKLTPEDAVIVVLGPTGVGKSHFIRAVTGDSSIKVGATLQSVTDRLNAYRTEIHGQAVVLVDTIGFDDTYRSDTDVLREIATWLAETYVERVHLAGVLYMHDIRNQRFSGSAMKNLRMFEKLVGEAALSNVVLVTNRWETVNLKEGEGRLKELIENHGMWGVMIQKGSTVQRFSGTAQDARSILKSVLDKGHRTILNIQQELVDLQLDLSETEAGKTLLEEFKKLQSNHMREMAELRIEMNKALKSKDVEMYDVMAKQLAKLERRLKDYQDQIPELKSQKTDVEELRRLHNEELRRLEDSFQDRLRFLEEQNLPPPPIYTETSIQRTDGAQAKSIDMISVVASVGTNCFWSLLILIWEFGQRLLRPQLLPGYRRLEWRCTCGELLYGDFMEATPGSLDNLAARLNEHSGLGSQQKASTSLQSPTKAHLRDDTPRMGWNIPGRGGNSGPDDPTIRVMAGGPSASNAQQRQTLQLCIETGKFTLELGELDLGWPYSDGLLFERIREKYEGVRQSILPMRLRPSKPDKVIFVKFRLGKRPFVSPIAGTIETPSIPSEDEVKAGYYRYIPCPIDGPPIDSRTFLHHFYAPASKHPDTMWGVRLPWKLGPGITPMTQGWGIHLEERPDWPLLAALMFFFLLLSGLVAGIYSWRTGDHQTGVAIGTWLTAVQATGMTALFFWWA